MIERITAAGHEARLAIRSLSRDPALVLGVTLTLALAIGANAAMFGLVSRLLLPSPPGVSDADRIGRLPSRIAPKMASST